MAGEEGAARGSVGRRGGGDAWRRRQGEAREREMKRGEMGGEEEEEEEEEKEEG